MIVIGLTGPARAGKDTTAEEICHRLACPMDSFARPIREMMLNYLGLTFTQVYGHDKERPTNRYGKSARHMMQTLGTEWGRDMVHPDIWLKALEARMNLTDTYLVVSDVRFENEAEWVRRRGILVHITGRGGIEGDHASENGIEYQSGDHIINNSGTLDDLSHAIGQFIKEADLCQEV